MALSKNDLKEIKKIMIDVLLDGEFVQKSDLKELASDIEEKISHLPNKEEFFASQDKLIKELKALREEYTVLSHQTSRNTDRITVVENKLNITSVL